jgi:hypothetical protein
MKNIILFFAVAVQAGFAQGQIALRPVIEHFTNTKCGVCASRNPGLTANLTNNPDVTHVSIHPSAPYATCFLSQHNTAANDARTNFYDLYGGTPRIVINGSVIPGNVSYTSGTLFTPYQALTTAFDVEVLQQKTDDGQLKTRVAVKKVSASTLSAALLFVGVVEDTINQNGGNGEQFHHNVLRRALTDAAGLSISLPDAVGDSAVFNYTTAMHTAWQPQRMYSLAILQQTDKVVLQTGKTTTASTDLSDYTNTSQSDANRLRARVWPNPVQETLQIVLELPMRTTLTVFDALGRQVYQNDTVGDHQLLVNNWAPGIYRVHLNNAAGSLSLPFIVK